MSELFGVTRVIAGVGEKCISDGLGIESLIWMNCGLKLYTLYLRNVYIDTTRGLGP